MRRSSGGRPPPVASADSSAMLPRGRNAAVTAAAAYSDARTL